MRPAYAEPGIDLHRFAIDGCDDCGSTGLRYVEEYRGAVVCACVSDDNAKTNDERRANDERQRVRERWVGLIVSVLLVAAVMFWSSP